MQPNERGLQVDLIKKLVKNNETFLKRKFGNKFETQPEGVIDNISYVLAACSRDIQEQIAFLVKQFNPETAEGQYQDALYMRVGLCRISETTTFLLKLTGTPNLTCNAESIFIQDAQNGVEFTNHSDFTLDTNGLATVTFQCLIPGPVEINEKDTFKILSAPQGISAIDFAENPNIIIGRNAETDKEFRERFKNSFKVKKKSNRDGIISTLLPFVDHTSYLQILSPSYHKTSPAGTIKIIALPNTTDEVFAKAIFSCVAFGIRTLGNTTVYVKDCTGKPVPISFEKAEQVPIMLSANIKIKSSYYKNSIIPNIKNNIIEYLKQRVYGLGANIYATEFTIPILKTDGVEAVSSIKVKSSFDEDFSDNTTLTGVQVPDFQVDRINIYEN